MKITSLRSVLTPLLSAALLVFCVGSFSNAQQPAAVVPTLVNFRGTLTDLNGKPLTGTVGVTFLLYKDQQGGAPLWIETQNVQADKYGRYSVTLGSTRSEGLPTELFVSGEARWMGVQPQSQAEQARVLLLSVPYALKAGDAQTVGGLPASAFVLAAAANSSSGATPTSSTPASTPPPGSSNVTTAGGTVNAIPLWSTATDVENSAISQTGSGTTAKIGIGTTAPTTTLDVKGTGTVRGSLTLPATSAATAAGGKNSHPQRLVASTFDGPISQAVNQTFQWQAEPVGNNTANPSGTLNLLYGLGSTTPSETGLNISGTGVLKFAPGQTFPGTTASVGLSAPSSDFTVSGSPITNAGTLNLAWNIAPTDANIASAIVKRDASGNFSGNTISANALYSGSLTLNSLSLVGTEYAYSTGTLPAVWGVAAAGTGSVQGVEGETLSTDSGASGVFGTADPFTGNSNGVYGVANANGAGVLGKNSGTGYGVYGVASGSAGQGVWGESSGGAISNGAPSDGVHGVSHSIAGSGVGGTNDATDGTGVWGSDKKGYGFATDSHTFQSRNAGGWVKAMAYINPSTGIQRCFTSQGTGSTATQVPCGMTFTYKIAGAYILDFGFKVDDRFLVLTSIGGTTVLSAGLDDQFSVTANQAYIQDWDSQNSTLVDFPFYVVVF